MVYLCPYDHKVAGSSPANAMLSPDMIRWICTVISTLVLDASSVCSPCG